MDVLPRQPQEGRRKNHENWVRPVSSLQLRHKCVCPLTQDNAQQPEHSPGNTELEIHDTGPPPRHLGDVAVAE